MDERVIRILRNHDVLELTLVNGKGRQALAAVPDAYSKLLDIGSRSDCDNDTRFKAFEAAAALAESGAAKPQTSPAIAEAMADVYVRALRSPDHPNRFGLPVAVRSSATSRRLIALGTAAERRLRPLLDDQERVPYEGSEEATIADERQIRYCDLAAALVAAIAGRPYVDGPTPAARDPDIGALRALVDSR